MSESDDMDDCEIEVVSRQSSNYTNTSVLQMDKSFDENSSMNSGSQGFDYLNQKSIQDRLRRDSQ